MSAADQRLRKLLPPAPVLVVLIGLIVFVPLGSWMFVRYRDWGYGGSPAAALDAPYFWGVLLLRLGGAYLLALLLFFRRDQASIWITVTSVWLTGPPLQLMLVGIQILASSGGQRSVPALPLHVLTWWSIGPAVVTVCLLAFPSSRQAYGLSSC